MVDYEDYDEDEVIESAEYSTKSDFSKARVVESQVQKCNEIRSKEMREGYYNTDKLGNKIYIPDSRKEWISAVTALKNLLRPEILTKKDSFKEETFIEEEKKLIETWGVDIGNGIKIVPLLDEYFQVDFNIVDKNRRLKGMRPQMVKGKYNPNFHRYWDDMVKVYDKVFAQLNILIHECNYFKQEVSY